jgi:ABC-type Fe3+/spermidine/putrescine transport system ATPase subunit
MRHEIRRICDEIGVTMLYVTHSQDEALFLSDELSIMKDGHLIEEGKPHIIHEEPKSFFGMTFLGQCNVLPGTVTSIEGEEATLATAIGDLRSTQLMDDLSVGDETYVCFRPKFVGIYPTGAEPDEDVPTVEGVVTQASTTTDFFEFTIEVEGTIVKVRSPQRVGAAQGETVTLAIDESNIKVFDQDRDLSGETLQIEGPVVRTTA